MHDSTNPPLALLEAAPRYIYSITGPGGRVYIGQHKHIQGESWTDYTGSGVRLRDEMAYLEPHAFSNPSARSGNVEKLARREGTALHHYTKRYLEPAFSRNDADLKETSHIKSLMLLGGSTYNMEQAREIASSYQQRVDALAFELSFEPRVLAGLASELDHLSSVHPPLVRGGFDLQYDALVKAEVIRAARSKFRQKHLCS